MTSTMLGTVDQVSKSPTRAYVLIQSTGNSRDRVIKILSRQKGVVAADAVEGPPDVVVVIEAMDRPTLASVLMKAMASVEDMTEGLQLLPTQERARHSRRSASN